MTTRPCLPFEAALRWRSEDAAHCDRCYFGALEASPDVLPADLFERLAAARPGDTVTHELSPGELFPARHEALRHSLQDEQFRRPRLNGSPLEPRVGRFYPRSLLSGVAWTPPHDRGPFRCLGRSSGRILVDFNHPLAGRSGIVELRPMQSTRNTAPRAALDWHESLSGNGPGMQAPLPISQTDFYSGEAFARQDAADDAAFYRPVRLVDHLDATAAAQLRDIYGRLLEPGMAVLDLMSSWNSHLPDALDDLRVTGLGMNLQELERNGRLSARVVHDLNRDAELPFADETFDAAICTVSVEYLTRPMEVLRSVARVLKPGAPFIITCSERWFPPKVVRIWTELHPFERVALVLEWLRRSGGFTALATESVRGLPRPRDDKYADLLSRSDAIYAIWGVRRGAAA